MDASCAPVFCPLFRVSFIGACPSSTRGQSYLPTYLPAVQTSHLHYAPQLAPAISGRRQPHVGMRVGGEGSGNFHTPERSINITNPTALRDSEFSHMAAVLLVCGVRA